MLLVLASCGLPRDPSGTMDRVERTNTLRLGVVEGAQIDEPTGRTLAQLTRQTGSRIEYHRGDSEELLGRLEHGELDLVFGRFPMDSPWSKKVYFGTAQGWLGQPPKSEPAPRLAAMHGENGWIMQVAKASQ